MSKDSDVWHLALYNLLGPSQYGLDGLMDGKDFARTFNGTMTLAFFKENAYNIAKSHACKKFGLSDAKACPPSMYDLFFEYICCFERGMYSVVRTLSDK